MKKIGLRKAIQLFGGDAIELHKGYHYQYGFFEKGGQLYYINTQDDRCSIGGLPPVMYRTAKHRKDWTGGNNTWDFCSTLKSLGYELK